MAFAPPPPLQPLRPPLPAPVRALAAAIAVLLVAGVLTAAVRGIEPGGPDHPDEWDPRVAALADYVERARGLEFDHPVEVEFLSPDEYREVTGGELSAEDAEEEVLEELTGQVERLRALGVVSGDLDLAEVLSQTADASTLAFYRPDDETIRVRGTKITVGLKVTLVHELTHVLQDQHFDLDGLLYGADVEPDEASAALGLIEGDAIRIEERFVAEVLSEDEQAAYDEEYQGEIDRSEAGNTGVPSYIQATFSAPYALGPTFALMLANAGGNADVDAAFSDPPRTEEHLFDPASFLAQEQAARVSTGLDEDDVDEVGPFGITQWFLVLAERLDPFVALRAALGWDGDQYAVFERDGTTCVRAVFRGDTEEDEAEMGRALDRWLEVLPGGKATRVDVDERPGFEACDPGPDVDMHPANRANDALVVPYLWSSFIAGNADAGPELARCIASTALPGGDGSIVDVTQVVGGEIVDPIQPLTYEMLVDPDPSVRAEVSDDLDVRAVLAATRCGSGER